MHFEQLEEIKLISLKNLLKTDALGTTVIKKDGYFVVKTFLNPSTIELNYLAFLKAPTEEDLKNWQKIYSEEFVGTKVKHVAYTWDSVDEGAINHFLNQGFKNHKYYFYQITQPPEEILIFKKIKDDQGWQKLNKLSQHWGSGADKIIKRYRKACSMELAFWYLVEKGDKVVGDIGVISDNKQRNSVFHVKGDEPYSIMRSFKEFSQVSLYIECHEQSQILKLLVAGNERLCSERNFLYLINM